MGRTIPILVVAALAAVAGAQTGPQDGVEATIARVRAQPREQRWRLIPWRTSLRVALAEAREAAKPVFLFGYDGILESGNC